MNNSFKNLFNKTDTIIAIIIYAMIVFLWNAADNFDSVSDLFAQNIPPQLFPQILLITIGLLTVLIPFEHILLKKSENLNINGVGVFVDFEIIKLFY